MFKRILDKIKRKPLTREEELKRKYKGMTKAEIIDYLCMNERFEELKEMHHYWFADSETRELCSAFEGCPISFFMEYMAIHKNEKYKYYAISLYDEDRRNIFFWEGGTKMPYYPDNYIITKLYYTGLSSGFYGRVKKVEYEEIIKAIKEMPVTKTRLKYLSQIVHDTLKGGLDES
jgi:hypothetical protein